MGLTNFPNGVFATPNVGGSDRSAIFASANIFFVDGDLGSASSSSSGLNPDEAVSKPSEAVSKAIRGAVLYVRPRMTVASVQTYYADNITIPVTKPGVQILGCGDPDNPYLGVDLKASTVTSNVVTVNGAAVVLDGLRLAGTGQTLDVASIVLVQNNGTTTRAYGFTIRNCRLGNGKGTLINLGAAISIDTAIGIKVQNCIFSDNVLGITAQTDFAAVNGLIIDHCVFGGAVATRNKDIWITGTGKGLLINDCQFIDGLPTAGNTPRFIVTDTSGLLGMLSNTNFAMTGATMDSLIGTAGADAIISTGVFIVNCHGEGTAEGIGVCSR